jgi:hypothetical protein
MPPVRQRRQATASPARYRAGARYLSVPRRVLEGCLRRAGIAPKIPRPRPKREQLTELFAIHRRWNAVAAALRMNYQALMHARKPLGMEYDQN